MDTNRRIAVVIGVAFLVATLAQLVGVALVFPILSAPDYLARISADESSILVGAIFQSVGALACTGIALALYPVLRSGSPGLAIAAVGFRTIEGVLHVLVAVCWLLLVTLSHEAVNAGAQGSAAVAIPGAMLMAAPDWLAPLGLLAFGLGALCYYWALYQSRLIPRWLSTWGLVAIALAMASAVLVVLGLIDGFSTPQLVLTFPILVQEMVLAVWLIAKGFTPSAIAAEAAGERSVSRAAVSRSAA